MKNRKNILWLSVLTTALSFSFLAISVNAADEKNVTEQLIVSDEFELSEIKEIDVNRTHASFLMDKIDISDGITSDEIKRISEVSDITITESVVDEYRITDYILKPVEPLATIIKNDGTVVYYNEQTVCRSIVKEVGWAGNEKVISNAVVASEVKYFHYDISSMGPTVKKIYSTETTITGNVQNIKKIQMNASATGVQRYNENGVYVGAGQEINNGTIYTVSGLGPYTEYNSTQYYYSTSDPNAAVYVTIKLTLATNSTSSFVVRVI